MLVADPKLTLLGWSLAEKPDSGLTRTWFTGELPTTSRDYEAVFCGLTTVMVTLAGAVVIPFKVMV